MSSVQQDKPRDRWITLDGVVNMRDIGGLPTRSGERTAYGRLIRSDNLQDLSPADVRTLVEEHHVRDIVDLRTGDEVRVTGKGPLWAEESLAHHHHSLIERLSGAATTTAAEDALAVVQGARRDAKFWADHYAGYLDRRADSVSAAIEVIARSEGATIVHCAAGKDRTGTIVALTLDAVGVAPEAIVEDYALTAERLEQIIERLMSSESYAMALRTQRLEDQLPRRETMESILAMLHDQHGGAAEWLRAQGWRTDDLDRLRRKLIG